jgi:hypothetical protein
MQMATVETINPLDDTARLRFHREVEADIAETQIPEMTDAELVAVIINDPDTATRRKALHVLRIREFTLGTKVATSALDAVMGLYK